jgi:hypothetical protein
MKSDGGDVTTEFAETLYTGTALTTLALYPAALLVYILTLVAFCLIN